MPVYTNFGQLNYIQNELDDLGLVQEYNEITQTETPPPPPPVIPYMEASVYDPANKQQQVITNSDVSAIGEANKIVKVDGTSRLPNLDGSQLSNITLNQLSDVIITGATTGQVVKYNGVSWINDTDAGGGGGSLATLSDVVLTAVADNQPIKYDTTTSKWINEAISYTELSNVPNSFTPSAHTIDSHSNVVISAIADKNALRWDNATSKWVNSFIDYPDITNKPTTFTPSTHSHLLSDLTNFNINTPLDNQAMKYDTATSKWINEAVSYSELTNIPSSFAPSAHTLDSHSNVVISAIADKNALRWDNATSKWVNSFIDYPDITNKPTTFTPSTHSHLLSDLTNFNINTPLDNQAMKYDTATSKWINEAVSYSELTNIPSSFTPSAHTIDSHSNVVISAIADKNALRWDNATSKWVNSFIDYPDITNKPTTFTPSAHTHAPSEITAGGATDGAYLFYNGVNWVPYIWMHCQLLNNAGFNQALSLGVKTTLTSTSFTLNAVLITGNTSNMTATIGTFTGTRTVLIAVTLGGVSVLNNSTNIFAIAKNGVDLPSKTSIYMENGRNEDVSIMNLTTVQTGDLITFNVTAGAATTIQSSTQTCNLFISEV